MNKYEIRTNQKKNSIIQSALKLFSEKGFTDTSMKEIAALANVSQVSIYNYFASKDGLVVECAKIIMKDTFQNMKELLTKDMNYKDKLTNALSECSNQISLSLTDYFSHVALSDSALFNLLTESINEMKKEIYFDFIELGKREKAIDPSIPSDIIIKVIDSLNKIELNKEAPEEDMNGIYHLFLYGIIGK